MGAWSGIGRGQRILAIWIIAGTAVAAGGVATTIALTGNQSHVATRASGLSSQAPSATPSLKSTAGMTPSATTSAHATPAHATPTTRPAPGQSPRPAAPQAATQAATQAAAATTPASVASRVSYTPVPLPMPTMSLVGGLSGIDTLPYSYSSGMGVQGGRSPYTWSVSGLPSWLSKTVGSYGSSLSVSGTPTTSGTFVFSVTVRDSESTPQVLTGTYSVTVNPLPWSTEYPATLTGTVGVPYSGTFTATNGVTVTWTATGVPPGLSMNSSTGTLSGTPTTAGSYLLSVSATDTATGVTKQAGNFDFFVKNASLPGDRGNAAG